MRLPCQAPNAAAHVGGAAKAALAHVDAATGSVAGGLRGAAFGVADRAGELGSSVQVCPTLALQTVVSHLVSRWREAGAMPLAAWRWAFRECAWQRGVACACLQASPSLWPDVRQGVCFQECLSGSHGTPQSNCWLAGARRCVHRGCCWHQPPAHTPMCRLCL